MVVLTKVDSKTWSVFGFADSATCLIASTGATDHFDSMPPVVKSKFGNLKAMKRAMNLDQNSDQKIVVIVLSKFRKKGPDRYEIKDKRIRQGYGSATITLASPELSAKNVQKFFGTTGTTAHDSQKIPVPSRESQEHSGWLGRLGYMS